jgi:hypothetical protein
MCAWRLGELKYIDNDDSWICRPLGYEWMRYAVAVLKEM